MFSTSSTSFINVLQKSKEFCNSVLLWLSPVARPGDLANVCKCTVALFLQWKSASLRRTIVSKFTGCVFPFSRNADSVLLWWFCVWAHQMILPVVSKYTYRLLYHTETSKTAQKWTYRGHKRTLIKKKKKKKKVKEKKLIHSVFKLWSWVFF